MEQSAMTDCARFGLLAPLLITLDAWIVIGLTIRSLL